LCDSLYVRREVATRRPGTLCCDLIPLSGIKSQRSPARPGSAHPRRVDVLSRVLMGLRAALGEDRPLRYATSMAVKAGLASDKGTASNALRRLQALRIRV